MHGSGFHRNRIPRRRLEGAPARNVTLLQRKAERPGKRLGKTTGWIHRSTLKMKGVKMIGGVNYEDYSSKNILYNLIDKQNLYRQNMLMAM